MDRSLYLDYNATCPMDEQVKNVISNAMDIWWENPSCTRGGGQACKTAIEEARNSIAKMINAKTEEILFTSGGTESNNMVIYSVLQEFRMLQLKMRQFSSPPDDLDDMVMPHIITINIEHPSISKILEHMESYGQCMVTRVPVDPQTGAVSASDIMKNIRKNTCLITLMWANNETGVIQPIQELSKLLREDETISKGGFLLPEIRLHTDAAQVIGKLPVDVGQLHRIDFLTIVGHKFYGPRNGALYIRRDIPFNPQFFGGGQENGRRPGTENTPMIVGLGKAAELVTMDQNAVTDQLNDTRNYFEMRLKETFSDQIVVHFQNVPRLPNTSSVAFKNIRGTAADLLSYCTRLVASTGAACHSNSTSPSAVLLACGIPNHLALRTIRFSVGRKTSKTEMDQVIEELIEAVKKDQMKDKINEGVLA